MEVLLVGMVVLVLILPIIALIVRMIKADNEHTNNHLK